MSETIANTVETEVKTAVTDVKSVANTAEAVAVKDTKKAENFFVHVYDWVKGELVTTVHAVESETEALVKATENGAWKIFDKIGNLIHNSHPTK